MLHGPVSTFVSPARSFSTLGNSAAVHSQLALMLHGPVSTFMSPARSFSTLGNSAAVHSQLALMLHGPVSMFVSPARSFSFFVSLCSSHGPNSVQLMPMEGQCVEQRVTVTASGGECWRRKCQHPALPRGRRVTSPTELFPVNTLIIATSCDVTDRSVPS